MAQHRTRTERAPRYVPRAPLEPARALATAVLKQAVHDLRRGDAATRAEVEQWMDNLPAVQLWCDIIDVDPHGFRMRALQRSREG